MRTVIRCTSCNLNQFVTSNGRCRRCHHLYGECVEKPQPVLESVVRPDVGRVIREYRELQELSQVKLADMMNRSRAWLAEVERNKSTYFTVDDAREISWLLKMDINLLVRYKEVKTVEAKIPDPRFIRSHATYELDCIPVDTYRIECIA